MYPGTYDERVLVREPGADRPAYADCRSQIALPLAAQGTPLLLSKKASECEHPLVSRAVATYDRHHFVKKVDGGYAVAPSPVDLKKMKFCLVDRTHSEAVMLLTVLTNIDARNWVRRRIMVRPFEWRPEFVEKGSDFIKH